MMRESVALSCVVWAGCVRAQCSRQTPLLNHTRSLTHTHALGPARPGSAAHTHTRHHYAVKAYPELVVFDGWWILGRPSSGRMLWKYRSLSAWPLSLMLTWPGV